MLSLSAPEVGIEITQGLMAIKDQRQQTQILAEASMTQFETFYRYWTMAMVLAKSETFVNAWVFMEDFRAAMVSALEAIGLKDVGFLSPGQLEALLLTHDGQDGLIFRLHRTFPKLRPEAFQMETQSSGSKLRPQQILTSLESTPIQNWLVRLLYRAGLSVASWAISLSSPSPDLPVTPPTKTSSSTKSGEVKS